MSPSSHNIPSTASPQTHGPSSSPRPPVTANQYPPGRPEARSHTLSNKASFSTPAANHSMNLPAYINANERDRTLAPDHSASALSSIPVPISLKPPASRAPAGFGVRTGLLSSDSSPSTTFAVAGPRSSSLPFSSVAPMGQGVSKSHSDSTALETPPPSSSNTPSKALGNAGQKLRRALARRKKVDEGLLNSITGEEHERWGGEHIPTLIPAPSMSLAPAKVTSSILPAPPSPKRSHQLSQLATHVLNAGKRTAKTTLSPPSLNQPQLSASSPPHPKAHSNAVMRRKLPPIPVSTETHQNQLAVNNINRSSIIPISPGISSAINYMRLEAIAQEQIATEQDQHPSTSSSKEESSSEVPVRSVNREAAEAPAVLGNPRDRGQDKGPDVVPPEVKEAWRKSDSATSYHTIRPGAGSSRPSRPTSVAESLHSNHTVVPKRLSGLIGDADFGMPEEDDGGSRSKEDSGLAANQEPKVSTTPTKTKNRRSISLNIGANPFKSSPPSTPPLSNATASFSTSEALPSTKPKNTSAFTQADFANPPINPIQPLKYGSPWNVGDVIAMQNINHSTIEHRKPSLPLSHRFMPVNAPRQPSISMSSTFAPAAGLARKAVEKIGWPWSSHSHSQSIASNNNPGYASSSSSQTSHPENALTRINSHQSATQAPTGIQSMHKLLRPKARRTPNGPSGSWSIHSNATASSMSDSDAPPPEPIVGRCLRPPLRGKVAGLGGATGMVFGRELIRVVHQTAIMAGATMDPQYMDEPPLYLGLPTDVAARWGQARAFELRCLPALIVRCAQHLLIWGVQEEGLFRVSGRPAHVAKIRTEFDSGADFDMIECTPGDLDPHAVASVFKAYLRELPEPLLTHALMPYFEAALSQENKSPTNPPPTSRLGGRGPGLPSGPRLGPGNPPPLRKPPSLSTLAMPTMTATQPPSKELIGTLTKLIGQLPQENRDLLRTVTDLMKVTASQSKETKMPLSNLLLVFCPSLNMNPPLLRALCEIGEIWGDEPDLATVIDIKRQTLVPNRGEAAGNEGSYRSRSGSLASEASRMSDSRSSVDDRYPTPTYEDDDDESISDSHKRDTIHAPQPSFTTSSDTPSLQDDSSCSSSTHPDTPSPAFSLSSTESLATPPTSSGAPSVAHLPTEQDPISRLNSGDDNLIATQTDALAIPSNKNANDSPPPSATAPVEFPVSQEPVPNTPVSKRRSIPTLSLISAHAPVPESPSIPDSPSSFSSSRRLKRPSLNFFSKRSTSSLNSIPQNRLAPPGPYLHTTHSASDTSVSTPISAVTAQSSPRNLVSLPPQLDTPFDNSPGLRINFASSPATPGLPRTTSSKSTPGSNVSPKSNNAAANAPSHLRPHPTRGRLGHNDNVSTTLLTLSTENEPDEDWTQSVLLAADVEGTWLSASR